MMKKLKSKAVWTAIVTVGVGIGQACGYAIPEYVLTLLGAFGLYSVRDAVGYEKK